MKYQFDCSINPNANYIQLPHLLLKTIIDKQLERLVMHTDVVNTKNNSNFLASLFLYNKILFSIIETHMKNSKGTKVTFKTEDAIIGLINQLLKMRSKLYQLIDQSPSDYVNPKLICSIVKNFPKTLQRNKIRYNQLQLCSQLQKILEYFISLKQKMPPFRKNCFRIQSFKHKPYQLVLYFRQFSELLSIRIRAGLTGNIQHIVNSQQNYQLFYLINELDYLKKEIENWALKQDKKINKSQNQSVQLVYPDSSTFRKTLAATTDVSKNLSKHEKHSTLDQFNQRSSEICLLRALTAKMKKREVKMTTRCPSAASILKNSSYKQPLFQSKRPILKYKHKSTDFQSKTYRINFDYPENLKLLQSNQNSRLKFDKKNLIKERNISFLNMSIIKNEEDGFKLKINQKIVNQNQKLRKTGILHIGIKNQEKASNFLSNQEILSFINNDNNFQTNSQCQIVDPESIEEAKDKVKDGRKQIKVQSCEDLQLQSNLEKSSFSSSLWNIQQDRIYIKQRQIYKRGRRSGKVMIKDKDKNEFKDIYMINMAKSKNPSNFSRRRIAVLSTHNQEMSEIQKILNIQNQKRAQKQLDYNQNVFLAFSDALRSKQNVKQNKEPHAFPKNQQGFNELFNQMNDFLRNYYTGKPNQESQSVFFQQQKRIRFYEDYHFRQKMKELININGNLNVFEIPISQTNQKQQIYKQLHRYFTFNSDSDWIKNMLGPKQALIQRQL